MQKDEIQVLLQAAKRLNINPSELKAINPWTQKGPRAEAMQMAALEVNPAMAAKWRSESGDEISLQTVAYEHGLVEGSKEIFDDLYTLRENNFIEGGKPVDVTSLYGFLFVLQQALNGLNSSLGISLVAAHFSPAT